MEKEILAAVFTIEHPASDTCKRTRKCLKLEAIMKNEYFPFLNDPKIIPLVIASLNCLATLMNLKCVQLDAMEGPYSKGYYQNLGYKLCGEKIKDTNDGMLYPMRKTANCPEI